MITGGFQVGRTGFRPYGKEKGKVELQNGEAEKGISQQSQRR